MIYLMRHGLDDERYIGGWSDVGLIDKGIKQVEDSTNYLKRLTIDKIISSDVKRTKETAEIVNKELSLNIVYDSRFRELDKGILTGVEVGCANEIYPNIKNMTIYDRYPNGESMIELYSRVKDLLIYIKSLDDILIITHRGVINMIYYILNDLELDMNKKRFNVTHGSIHELDFEKKLIRRIY